jgi:hypothetical protein
VPGVTVAVLAPTFGQAVLLALFEHLETANVVEITVADPDFDEREFAPGSRSRASKLSLNAH